MSRQHHSPVPLTNSLSVPRAANPQTTDTEITDHWTDEDLSDFTRQGWMNLEQQENDDQPTEDPLTLTLSPTKLEERGHDEDKRKRR